MEVIENKDSNRETIVLDDKFFVNCHFTNCNLMYSGGEMLSKDSRFDNCPLQFSGAASRTVNLLTTFGVLKPGMPPPGAMPMPVPGKPH